MRVWKSALAAAVIGFAATTGATAGLATPAGATAGLAAPAGDTADSMLAVAAGIQTIYMSPTGADANSGATPATAVRTLQRVEDLVAADPADSRDVEIRIHAGTYVSAPITWNHYRTGHTISFMPDDYTVGEGSDGIAARPVFHNSRLADSNRYAPGYWFQGCLADAGEPLADGGTSDLRFYYLQVEYYSSGAISLNGSTGGDCSNGAYHPTSGPGLPSARGLNGNTIFGMSFTSLGNQYTGGDCAPDSSFKRCGYGGVTLTESSNNRIANNHFVNLRNAENSYIHAAYITHKSRSNQFTGNNVTGVSSDPVKVRDASDYNTFDSNTFGANDFLRSSIPPAVHYLEEVGDGECSSYHNRFTNNDLGSFLVGSTADLPKWYLSPGDGTWPGPSGCPALPAGESRLTTANNNY